ncbi:MAG: hypothetical protein IT556_11620 [Acetobacteraceae bacterium]|nr:hypothetical protein [Acetobacteraceae bacterium]
MVIGHCAVEPRTTAAVHRSWPAAIEARTGHHAGRAIGLSIRKHIKAAVGRSPVSFSFSFSKTRYRGMYQRDGCLFNLD